LQLFLKPRIQPFHSSNVSTGKPIWAFCSIDRPVSPKMAQANLFVNVQLFTPIFAHKQQKMTDSATNPGFSRRIFWDVDYESIDYQKDKLYIIDKVMNFGVWEDFRAMIRFYGKDLVKREIVKVPYLKKDVLNFACFYFGLKPAQFKCYTRRQLQEPHWDF
jgi:hypothetical protein